MYRFSVITLSFLIFAIPVLAGNTYLGVSGGFGTATSITATSGGTSANAGFQPGAAVGAFVGNDPTNLIGGEIRYLFLFDNLKVSQGGTAATMSGRSHLIHYDVLSHARGRNSPIRPYVAGGGGIRWIEGTGAQQVYQPLSQYALLTATREVVPVISAGAGVKFRLSKSLSLRTEVRDYIGPHPTKVIAAPPGATVHGWIHEIVGQVGLTVTFR